MADYTIDLNKVGYKKPDQRPLKGQCQIDGKERNSQRMINKIEKVYL